MGGRGREREKREEEGRREGEGRPDETCVYGPQFRASELRYLLSSDRNFHLNQLKKCAVEAVGLSITIPIPPPCL